MDGELFGNKAVDISLLEAGENAVEAFDTRACPTDQLQTYDAKMSLYVRYLT
jgi:hypothetical protein